MSKEDILKHAKQIEISIGILESLVDQLEDLTDDELAQTQQAVKRLNGSQLAKGYEAAWTLRNLRFGAWLRRTHQLTEEQVKALEQDADKYRQWRDAFERERLSK